MNFLKNLKMTKEQMQQALIINGWEPILPHKRHLWVTKTDGYKWAYSTEVAYHKMLNGKS
jgi:hypothetical protein